MTARIHESTIALSVYNAIQRLGAMNREQILTKLKAAWDPVTDLDEIDGGIAYLLKRTLVIETDGVVSARIVNNGAAATVVRDPCDQTELRVVMRKQG